MKLGKKLTVLVFGLSVMGTAVASEEYIGSTDGSYIYLLNDRVKNKYDAGKTVKSVWFKWVINKDLKKGGIGVGDYILDNWYIQCDDSKYSRIKRYAYAKNKRGTHEIIDEYEQHPYGLGYNYQEVIPYGIGEVMLNHVCEKY